MKKIMTVPIVAALPLVFSAPAFASAENGDTQHLQSVKTVLSVPAPTPPVPKPPVPKPPVPKPPVPKPPVPQPPVPQPPVPKPPVPKPPVPKPPVPKPPAPMPPAVSVPAVPAAGAAVAGPVGGKKPVRRAPAVSRLRRVRVGGGGLPAVRKPVPGAGGPVRLAETGAGAAGLGLVAACACAAGVFLGKRRSRGGRA